MDLEVKVLLEEEDIINSKELLYRIYVEKLGWNPWVGLNSSNIRVADGINGNILEDDFDASAIYFGAFYKGVLIGRHRCLLHKDNDIELMRYVDLGPLISSVPLVEFNRFACARESLTPAIFFSLASSFIQDQRFSHALPITATASASLKRLYNSADGMKKIEDFKYENSDENEASLFIITGKELIVDFLAERNSRTRLCRA